jgi:hypothetical protein
LISKINHHRSQEGNIDQRQNVDCLKYQGKKLGFMQRKESFEPGTSLTQCVGGMGKKRKRKSISKVE